MEAHLCGCSACTEIRRRRRVAPPSVIVTHGPYGKVKMSTNRRTVLQLMGGLAIAGYTIRPAFAELPKLEKKDKYKVGFAQTESNNPWRLAQTASMKAEAEKRGWQLAYTDAAGSAAKQVADVRSMIAQNVDVILLAPREKSR